MEEQIYTFTYYRYVDGEYIRVKSKVVKITVNPNEQEVFQCDVFEKAVFESYKCPWDKCEIYDRNGHLTNTFHYIECKK